jgi:hypothetical protein
MKHMPQDLRTQTLAWSPQASRREPNSQVAP